MTIVTGTCDSRFENVRETFQGHFEQGLDVGSSVAITMNGEFVVDLCGGHWDREQTRPWESDTIVNVWSTTKTMAAMSLLLLADRGEVDLHAAVKTYWPEFAQNGKEGIEVRHFLSHSAGLSGMDEPVTGDKLYDWDWMVGALARQAPWWEPGTQSGYHALTQGHLIGEVVRRVTGQSLGQFFKSEIADPLGADFHIGTSEEFDDRLCPLIPPETSGTANMLDGIAKRTFANPAVDASACNTTSWRRAEIPAANGHGNAHSVAKIQTVMANGGEAFGKRIMSEEGTRRIFDEQTNGPDLALGVPIRYGMGYGLTSELIPIGPNPHSCFWGGYGGSVVIVDQDARMCISFVMNRMEPGLLGDPRGFGLVAAAYEALAAA